MNKERPKTTLFMLMSVDGKISTGRSDKRDFDKDLPTIDGVSQGLNQYYDLEQQTDLFSFNTGLVQAKIGVNNKSRPDKLPVSFIVVDNLPHLNENGVNYFIQRSKTFFLVTSNKQHPAYKCSGDNLEILLYDKGIDFTDLFMKFKTEYGIEAITLQSGGTLNSVLLREGLIDRISVVVAPCLIGGKDTPSLIDGYTFTSVSDLSMIKPLVFKECRTLKDSYINLIYDVQNN